MNNMTRATFVFLILILLVTISCRKQPATIPQTADEPAISSQPINSQDSSTEKSTTATFAPPVQPDSVETPVSQLEPGWSIYRDEDAGFEIAKPDSWSLIKKEQLRLMSSAEHKCIYYTYDPLSKSEVLPYAGSFSIMIVPLKTETTLSAWTEQNRRDLETDPTVSQPVSIKQIELLTGEAVEIIYTCRLPNRTGPVVFRQYCFIKGKEIYMFTSETVPERVDKYSPVYQMMAESFRFLQ